MTSDTIDEPLACVILDSSVGSLSVEVDMIIRSWETIKVIYCNHADAEVGLQADIVYPPEILPDQPPRVLGHRCSRATECNLMGKPSCIWAGTNPTYDPFLELP